MISRPTSNHAEIFDWAMRHAAVPAEAKLLKFDGEPSALYIMFGDARGGTPEIRPISWEDFFARFDLMELTIVFDDSPFYQLLNRRHPHPLPTKRSN